MLDDLPVELVRAVFERAAARDARDACALALVSRAVHEWMLPVLLHSVRLRSVGQAARFFALLHARAGERAYFCSVRSLVVACPTALGFLRGAELGVGFVATDAKTGARALFLTAASLERLVAAFPALAHFGAPRNLLDVLTRFPGFRPRALAVDGVAQTSSWPPRMLAAVARLDIAVGGRGAPRSSLDLAHFVALTDVVLFMPPARVPLAVWTCHAVVTAVLRHPPLQSLTAHVAGAREYDILALTLQAIRDPRLHVVRTAATKTLAEC